MKKARKQKKRMRNKLHEGPNCLVIAFAFAFAFEGWVFGFLGNVRTRSNNVTRVIRTKFVQKSSVASLDGTSQPIASRFVADICGP